MDIETFIENKHADEIRDMWQARALLATQKSGLGLVVLSVLAHNYDEGDAFLTFMHVLFPGFKGLVPPMLCSAGKVDKTGAVVADVMTKFGAVLKDVAIFRDTNDMQGHFRRLADRLKLSDADRIDMFKAAGRWLVADRRLDPTMDYRDPEAKRLVVH